MKKLHKDIGKTIFTYEDRQKPEVRTEVGAVARGLGYTLAKLTLVSENCIPLHSTLPPPVLAGNNAQGECQLCRPKVGKEYQFTPFCR